MIDIEKLKQAARAATQGEWETQDTHSDAPYVFADQGKGFNNPTICNFYDDVTPEDSVTCGAWYEKHDNAVANAEFIATANPSAVLELITRLEAAESKQILGASARQFKQMEAAADQLAASELHIQQLRDALSTSAHVFLHLEANRCLEEVNKALAIPTSTEHLEAWYKEMVGEPTGYYFRDDPEKFAMPGSGYSHDYPTEALDVVPLHAIKPFPFKEK